nr:RnfABCDGE type electron transport complex subunit D [Actinomycetota bacterium]
LLVIGPNHVFPQYLWWGPNNVGVALAYGVILVGGLWILPKVRMEPMVVAFMVTFATLIAVFALGGQSFIAIWHDGPVSGLSYWLNVAVSPEVLVFVFFMMSDPQTAPKTPDGRIIYGFATAVVAAGLTYFQPTEFGIKLAILSSLVVVCALVPFIEHGLERLGQSEAGDRARPAARPGAAPPALSRLAVAVRNPMIAAALIVAVAAPVNTAVLAGNDQVVLIERGLTGEANAQ